MGKPTSTLCAACKVERGGTKMWAKIVEGSLVAILIFWVVSKPAAFNEVVAAGANALTGGVRTLGGYSAGVNG